MAKIITLSPDEEIPDNLLKSWVKVLNDGGIICFPTETVYALAADAANHEAVNRIYEIKGRENCKPLSVLVGDIYQARTIVQFNDNAEKLVSRFFPGPLTIILKSSKACNLSSYVNRDIGTLGIRMPDHILSLKLLKAFGRPLIGTSANISKEKPATNAQELLKTIGDKVDIIIDQGEVKLGISSTIVNLSEDQPKILRVGTITEEMVNNIIMDQPPNLNKCLPNNLAKLFKIF